MFGVDPRFPYPFGTLKIKVVYNRREIILRYAKGWLIVDFLAAFPFTFLPGLGPDDADGFHEVAYLLSLPKIFRLYELLIVTQENHRIHEGVFLAIRTLISVVIVSRGCFCFVRLLFPPRFCFRPLFLVVRGRGTR